MREVLDAIAALDRKLDLKAAEIEARDDQNRQLVLDRFDQIRHDLIKLGSEILPMLLRGREAPPAHDEAPATVPPPAKRATKRKGSAKP